MKCLQQFVMSVGLWFAIGAYGQDLQIPNTPAFSILGYEPAAVMRPNSTKKLSSDILNSFDSNGQLLMNLGMEVSPYWLKSRPSLTREQYLNPKPVQAFLQTLSFSAATVKNTISGNNNLGLGFRFQLIKGQLTDGFQKAEAELRRLETAMAVILKARADAGTTLITINQAVDYILTETKKLQLPEAHYNWLQQKALELSSRFDATPAGIKAFCEALTASFEEKTDDLAKNGILLSNKRIGFSIEFASAAKFITTTGNQAFQKAGFWVNANNYFSPTDAWTLTARLMTATSDTISNNFDTGFGYIKEGNDFNVSIEGLLRWYRTEIPDVNSNGQPITRLEKDLTYRLAAQLSYTLAENISLNVSLGKDFEDARLSGSSFFSIFGFRYALFNQEKVVLGEK